MSRNRTRFNLLLLEDGEFLFDEYTAVAFVWMPTGEEYRLDTKQRGRVRICTRGVVFEPDDASQPIVRWNFRQTPGRPAGLQSLKETSFSEFTEAVAADSKPKDAFAFQPTVAIRAKNKGSAVPLEAKALNAKMQEATAPNVPVDQDAKAKGGKGRGLFGSSSSDSPGRPSKGTSSPVVGPDSAIGVHSAGRATVVIALQHAALSTVLPTVQQLWDIQQTCVDAAVGKERARIQPLVDARLAGPFDPSLLADYREKMSLPAGPQAVVAERVFPLVTVPGRFMVTTTGVYFMPVSVNNMAGSDAVQRWRLRDVMRIQRRTRLQREVGIELTLAEGTAGATAGGSDLACAGLSPSSRSSSRVFFSFGSPSVRSSVYKVILQALQVQERASGKGRTVVTGNDETPSDYDDVLGDFSPGYLARMTALWVNRSMSTFDYLTFCNDAAGRSVTDFSQYPVMPWVIADYTSATLDMDNPATFRNLTIPIGALNDSRLKSFRARFADMPRGEEAEAQGIDPPFLYGTHYSTPAYVLFFLVRAMPEHMLKLQAGKYDAPDRLFHDIASTWAGVTGINSDLKELIPEFYDSDGSFLLLPDGLNLGVRSNMKRVGDVHLPPWALDAGDFVRQCREALEAEYVSQHLHAWIDLVFGFKARGEAAIAADNLFHHLTYEGALDVEAMNEGDARAAVQSQIAEFGQTPRQLFTTPHPTRMAVGAISPPILNDEPVNIEMAIEGQRNEINVSGGDAEIVTRVAHAGRKETSAMHASLSTTGQAKQSSRVKLSSHSLAISTAASLKVWRNVATKTLGSDDVGIPEPGRAGITCITLMSVGDACTLILTTAMDGGARLHTCNVQGNELVQVGAVFPITLRPGMGGVYRSALLSHSALFGAFAQFPLRSGTALPFMIDSGPACLAFAAVAGIDGRAYILRAHVSPDMSGLSIAHDVCLHDGPLYALAAVPLTPSSVLLLGGTGDGSVCATVATLLPANGDNLHACVLTGTPGVVSKKGDASITSFAVKQVTHASPGGGAVFSTWRVAVGDAVGRVCVLDVLAQLGSKGEIVVSGPSGVDSVSASVVAHSCLPLCESVMIEALGRRDIAYGGCSGASCLAWLSLRQPVPICNEVEEGQGESQEEAGQAPALLCTTTAGQVAVWYAPDCDMSTDKDGHFEGMEGHALVLCGSMTTGEVLRGGTLVGTSRSVIGGEGVKPRGNEEIMLVGGSTTGVRAWALQPLLDLSAVALLAGFQAGQVDGTVPVTISAQDVQATAKAEGCIPNGPVGIVSCVTGDGVLAAGSATGELRVMVLSV